MSSVTTRIAGVDAISHARSSSDGPAAFHVARRGEPEAQYQSRHSNSQA